MGKGSLGKGLPDRVCSLIRVSRVSIVYLPPVFGPRDKGLFLCLWTSEKPVKWLSLSFRAPQGGRLFRAVFLLNDPGGGRG